MTTAGADAVTGGFVGSFEDHDEARSVFNPKAGKDSLV